MGDGSAIADSGTKARGDPSTGLSEYEKLEKVKKNVDKYLKDSLLSDSIGTTIEKRGLVLSFKDSLFFDSGNGDVRPEQVEKFIKIGEIINQSIISDSYIRVEGHTDSVPVHNNLYKSNWDLSVMRASNVAQILINQAGVKPDRDISNRLWRIQTESR